VQRSLFEDEDAAIDAAHQQDLDAKRAARASDPETSHAGAEWMTSKRARLHFEFLRRLGNGVKTANEVAQGDESIRKRAKELVDDGSICVIGRRKCLVTGQMATTYGRANDA